MTQNRWFSQIQEDFTKRGKSWQEVVKKGYGKLEEFGDLLLKTHMRQTWCISVVAFFSLLHFHTNSWCASFLQVFFILRCFWESHWWEFHEKTNYNFPGSSIIRLAKKETRMLVRSAEHNLELSVLERVCTQYNSCWYVFEVDIHLSRNCWNLRMLVKMKGRIYMEKLKVWSQLCECWSWNQKILPTMV